MKTSSTCYECLQRLTRQAAKLAASDEQTRARAIREGLKVLEENFSRDEVSIVIATKIHDAIKTTTQNHDPYREMKDKEIAIARELSREINPNHNDDLNGLLKLAAIGNAIDFFKPIDTIKRDIRGQMEFTIDDSEHLETRLNDATRVLYLADNAGEVFFDLPLLKWMRRLTSVVYVVKAFPVQNDITLDDIRRAGLESEIGDVITTGTATPGIDFAIASEQFKQEFANADFIFAKGMGYYESLSELPVEGRIFYCLMAKCQPVADSIKVPLNSYVAILK